MSERGRKSEGWVERDEAAAFIIIAMSLQFDLSNAFMHGSKNQPS
jgi:hypothetical protein